MPEHVYYEKVRCCPYGRNDCTSLPDRQSPPLDITDVLNRSGEQSRQSVHHATGSDEGLERGAITPIRVHTQWMSFKAATTPIRARKAIPASEGPIATIRASPRSRHPRQERRLPSKYVVGSYPTRGSTPSIRVATSIGTAKSGTTPPIRPMKAVPASEGSTTPIRVITSIRTAKSGTTTSIRVCKRIASDAGSTPPIRGTKAGAWPPPGGSHVL